MREKGPVFRYFLYNSKTPVKSGDPMWTAPLPVNRKNNPPTGLSVSNGEYFSALKEFLSKNNFSHLIMAVSGAIGEKITINNIHNVDIIIEKHGEFYHPARIAVKGDGFTSALVANGAVSPWGKKNIFMEYEALNRLGREFSFDFIPKAWAIGKGDIPVFLGEWFEGYHEFHLSMKDKNLKIVVWDNEKGVWYLSSNQTKALYRNMAKILAAFYHIPSFCMIYPWHHGAGDFILSVKDENIDVKLITVRGYEPVIRVPEDEICEAVLLEGLLFFLLHISLRMRIDRLDGVGELVWADDNMILPFLKGFFEGLILNPSLSGLSMKSFSAFFKDYLAARSQRGDLMELAETARFLFPEKSREHRLVKQKMENHIMKLETEITSLT